MNVKAGFHWFKLIMEHFVRFQNHPSDNVNFKISRNETYVFFL